MTYLQLWSHAFLLTLAVELAVATPLARAAEPSVWRRLAVVTFAQAASHPAVWFILPELRLAPPWFLVVAEAWAVGSETLIYRAAFAQARWSRALATSALANGASLLVGLLVRHLTHWA